jgi:hypothetical protein
LRLGSTIVTLTSIRDFLKSPELYRVAIRTIKYALLNKLNVENKDESRKLEPLLTDSESSDEDPTGVKQKKKSSFWEITKLLQEQMDAEAKNEHAVRAHKTKEVINFFTATFAKETSFWEHIFSVLFEDILLMQYTSKETFFETKQSVRQ